MNMIEVKTAELSGPALDWAVGVADGEKMFASAHLAGRCARRLCADGDTRDYYSPTTNWSQGGPLRDKYQVAVYDVEDGMVAATIREFPKFWIDESDFEADATGATALIAVCRAIVAAKLGETVQIPSELLQ